MRFLFLLFNLQFFLVFIFQFEKIFIKLAFVFHFLQSILIIFFKKDNKLFFCLNYNNLVKLSFFS